MIAYKIFDEHNEMPKTLFHGVRGSRSLSLDEWIVAERKLVTDGSRQIPYVSGFHAYPSLDAVKQWLKNAKNLEGRVVVKVQVKRLRKKPKAVRPTILADTIKITTQNWNDRRSAKDIIN